VWLLPGLGFAVQGVGMLFTGDGAGKGVIAGEPLFGMSSAPLPP
jgi:hypothetical protein